MLEKDVFILRDVDGLAGILTEVIAPGDWYVGTFGDHDGDTVYGVVRSYVDANPETEDAPVVFLARDGLILATYWDGVRAWAEARAAEGVGA